MNILLIGYRGTGKTTIARELALRLGRSWVDADVEVELAAGKSIRAIFAEDGEHAFRDWETQVLKQLLLRDEQVLALGGGVVLRQENRDLLAAAGPKFWLTASAATLDARIHQDETTGSRRPNLTADGGLREIEQLLARREPLYRQCADFQVDTEESTPTEVADQIVRQLETAPPPSPK